MFGIFQTQDALSHCIPGGGVDQHRGGRLRGRTEHRGMTEQMKVGQPPSCGVTGASSTNFASGGGLTWNMVGGVAWWLQIKYDNKNK